MLLPRENDSFTSWIALWITNYTLPPTENDWIYLFKLTAKSITFIFLKVTTNEILTYVQNQDFDDDEDDYNMGDDNNGMELWPQLLFSLLLDEELLIVCW